MVSNGVFRSIDQGESWTSINANLPGDALVAVFAVSGTNLYAGTTRSLSGRGFGAVFRSTDQGESWTAVNAGLTNLGVRALAVAGEKLFAGTFGGGVFFTDVEQ